MAGVGAAGEFKFDDYLLNIDEYIHDENKIVTYKWLSITLCLHVNTAKQLLYSYVDEQRNVKHCGDINVCYVIVGVNQLDDGSNERVVRVVREKDVESWKRRLSTVLACHIYSVQKSATKDSESLYMAHADVCSETPSLASSSQSGVNYTATPLSQDDVDTRAQQRSSSGLEACTGPPEKKSKPTISGMFDKAQKKDSTSSKAVGSASSIVDSNGSGKHNDLSKSSSSETKAPAAKDKGKAKQAGVMSFFSNQTTKSNVMPNQDIQQNVKDDVEASAKNGVSESTTATQKVESPAEQLFDDNQEELKEVPKSEDLDVLATESDPDIFAPSTKKPQSPKKQPQKKKAGGEGQGAAKRRRLHVFDSSSDEEMDESPAPSKAESAVVSVPPAPPSPPVRVPSPVPPSAPVAQMPAQNSVETHTKTIKKKKLVTKNFVNDEGFMVTEKVWEDEEVDVVEPKVAAPAKLLPVEEKKPAARKTGPKPGAKQSNLMSFFKKT